MNFKDLHQTEICPVDRSDNMPSKTGKRKLNNKKQRRDHLRRMVNLVGTEAVLLSVGQIS